jgi:tRNA A37 threonylcarbamoyladenosine dehydratase
MAVASEPGVTTPLPPPATAPRTHRRFDRAARLLGDEGIARLGSATATVIGLGGVGSFAAEALARTGLGRIILVDFDRICVTNTNRQLHAMKGTLGKPKAEVMAERLRAINPDAVIEPRREFYSDRNATRLLTPEPDVVLDAIDNLKAKQHLITTCLSRRLRIVSSMGAAARLDPTRVRVADLAYTRVDPFARHLRKDLRRKGGLDTSGPLGVWAVYSEETPSAPRPLAYDDEGFVCVCPGGHNGLHDCDHGPRVDGSLAFVPATFGLTLAATAVRLLCGHAVLAHPDRG